MRLLAPLVLTSIAWGQKAETFHPPRLADGHPDLQGIWRSVSVAAFNVEGQAASYNGPAGPSAIVDPADGKLPYLPAAKEKMNDNAAHRQRDPVGYCHMHGVPRTMVPPFP